MSNEQVAVDPVRQSPVAKCAAIAEAGITNSQQTIAYLSALIADGSAGRVTPGNMHAVCNAVGKMLRVVEMEARFGTTNPGGDQRCLQFVQGGPNQPSVDPRMSALQKLTREERVALGITA